MCKKIKLWYWNKSFSEKIDFCRLIFNIIAWCLVTPTVIIGGCLQIEKTRNELENAQIALKNKDEQLSIAELDEKRIKSLNFDLKLIDQYPIYLSEVQPGNGRWIGISYIFDNPNNFDIYYQVSWQLSAEYEGKFEPTAQYFAYNEPFKKVLKYSKDEGMIQTLIGKPQIDDIRDKKGKIEIIIITTAWYKQTGYIDIEKDKPIRQKIFKFAGKHGEDGSFSWVSVPFEKISLNLN